MSKRFTEQIDEEMRRRGAMAPDETYWTAIRRTVQAIGRIDKKYGERDTDVFIDELLEYLSDRFVGFSTTITRNSGIAGRSAASCSVLTIPINEDGALDNAAFLSRSRDLFDFGVGIGYSLDHLNQLDSTLEAIYASLEEINRPLTAQRARPVAAMLTVSASSPNVKDFIRLVSSADRSHLTTASIFVDEALFRRALGTVREIPSKEEIARKDRVHASHLIREIAAAIHSSGNPGILFRDRLDLQNAIPDIPILSTAPCAEVAMAEGDACHFGYVNLYALVSNARFDWVRLANACRILVRALDAIVDITRSSALNLGLVGERRRIGVCITGLADCLDALKLRYDSDEARKFAQALSEYIDYHTKVESTRLAEVRGPFPLFRRSRYLDKAWVERKRKFCVAEDLDWATVHGRILTSGIRNSTTTALSSAETASAFFGVSTSLEPDRFPETLPTNQLLNPASHLHYDQSHVSVVAQIKMQAAIQHFLDDAISKTITVPPKTTPKEIEEILFAAFEFGVLGVSIYRPDHFAAGADVSPNNRRN